MCVVTDLMYSWGICDDVYTEIPAYYQLFVENSDGVCVCAYIIFTYTSVCVCLIKFSNIKCRFKHC